MKDLIIAGASGERVFLDLYKQLTNQAVGYKDKNANNALVFNIDGSATNNCVFLL